jgi:sugar phosphate isomerase/epimerase
VLPVRGCNVFLRPGLRCTGPDADHPRVLAYAETAFRRLRRLGGSFIGFGSSAARQIPDDWPKARADDQFIALLQAMAPLAARHQITVSAESQRRKEVNYLNRIAEVVAVVAAVDHPNIRVLADFYHMAVMGDAPADIAAAGPWVGLTDIAERERRTVPGVAGDDFRPAFTALARAGYRGPITIEGDGSPDQLRRAFAVIAAQSREALAAAGGSA